MRCFNCGGEIPSNFRKCPYCNEEISSMEKQKMQYDNQLAQRFDKMDEIFGFNVDYANMNTEKLYDFFDRISEEFKKLNVNDSKIKSNLQKIMTHIGNVDEELQSRFSIRPGLSDEEIDNKFKSSGDIVLDLLDNYNPPEVYAAAFKIRSITERILKDKYKFKYYEKYAPYGKKPYHFEKSYIEMFNIVTNNNFDEAKQLKKDHEMLNLFIHEGKENDDRIKKAYPTKQEQVDNLKRAYALRKKWNLG